jgi:hypothetical protein
VKVKFNRRPTRLQGGRSRPAQARLRGQLATGFPSLVVQTEPTTGTDATALSPQPVIFCDDGFGRGKPGVTVTVSIESGTGTLTGTLTAVTNASGFATFTNVAVDIP